MSKFRTLVLGAVSLLVGVSALPAQGQGLANERINFTISAPFKLRKSSVELPAGSYVLLRMTAGEGGTFALYGDVNHEPLALINTIPMDDYTSMSAPSDTKILLDRTTLPEGEDPVLEGWMLPGGQGWEVIGVVANVKQIEARARELHPAEQRGAQ